MELQFLKAHSPMDWVSIDLILISLLITIITINVFILTRRLHHLEKHKMLDLEADYHDDHFLNKFRSLQTLNAEKGPFDEVAFRAFMNLNAGKDCTLITGTAEKRSTLDREALLQALVDFFKRYGSETPVTKNEGDTVTSPPEYSATGICDTNQGIASGTTGEASDVDSCDAQSEVSSVSEDWPETNQESSPKLSCSGCSKDPCVIAKECQNVVGWGCRICAKMWCTSCWDKIYAAAAALNPSMRLHSITCGCGGSVESYGSTFMLPHRQVLLQDAIKKVKLNPRNIYPSPT